LRSICIFMESLMKQDVSMWSDFSGVAEIFKFDGQNNHAKMTKNPSIFVKTCRKSLLRNNFTLQIAKLTFARILSEYDSFGCVKLPDVRCMKDARAGRFLEPLRPMARNISRELIIIGIYGIMRPDSRAACPFIFRRFDMRRIAVLAAFAVATAIMVGCNYEKEHHTSLAVVHSPGISGHSTVINYALLGEELTGINVYYSTNGQFWFPATRGYGGEAEEGLTTSAKGDFHTWSWDSLADIGPALSLNVLIKIVPWGRFDKGIPGMSPVFIVNNAINTRPTALISTTTGTSGDIVVNFGVADAEFDAVTAKMQFSVDGGSNFFDARLAGNSVTDTVPRLETTFPTEANDGANQLSSWLLSGLDLGTNTDANGRLYVELTDSGGTRQVDVYKDSAKILLVAQGTLVGDGTMTLAAQNSSGLSGSVSVAYSATDTDVRLTCYKLYSLVWDSLLDLGANNHPDVRLRIEVIDGEAAKSTPSYTPDTSPAVQISVDNT